MSSRSNAIVMRVMMIMQGFEQKCVNGNRRTFKKCVVIVATHIASQQLSSTFNKKIIKQPNSATLNKMCKCSTSHGCTIIFIAMCTWMHALC